MHWYVYRSRNAMKQSYASLGTPVVYSSKQQPRLCLGNVVWVVEGDDGSPVSYSVADCFIVQSIDEPSPHARHGLNKSRRPRYQSRPRRDSDVAVAERTGTGEFRPFHALFSVISRTADAMALSSPTIACALSTGSAAKAA